MALRCKLTSIAPRADGVSITTVALAAAVIVLSAQQLLAEVPLVLQLFLRLAIIALFTAEVARAVGHQEPRPALPSWRRVRSGCGIAMSYLGILTLAAVVAPVLAQLSTVPDQAAELGLTTVPCSAPMPGTCSKPTRAHAGGKTPSCSRKPEFHSW
ncbi:hypothetical protein C7C46_31485, partial [Streptomyces tateyamensis]